jgi:hypothetical protein
MKRFALILSLLLIFVLPANAQYAFRIIPQASLPATCLPGNGEVVYLTTGAIGLYQCGATNTWQNVGITGGATPIFTAAAAGTIGFTTRAKIASSADAILNFTDAAGAGFTRFTMGPPAVTTFPAIIVSAAIAGKSQGIIIGYADGTYTQFADLGAATNGSITYCANCTLANPCAGGGTGALAKRLNGVWVCN